MDKWTPHNLSLTEYIEAHGWTVVESGCWEWNGSRRLNGYGAASRDNKAKSAHRLAYEAWVGPIPEGLAVRHTCDNRPCINPDHLLVGTYKDNMDDRTKRGRANAPKGENHHAAKLTEQDVIEIRALYAAGNIKQSELAETYGVSDKNISLIVRGKRWAWVLSS